MEKNEKNPGITMNNTDLFIELYKQLEELAQKRYNYQVNAGESPVALLARRTEFRSIQAELDYCREVRNLMQHKPRLNDSYLVMPSNEMISLLRSTLEKVKNPPRAKDIHVTIQKTLYKSMDDLVLPTLLEMQDRVFTHIPILQNGVVKGVFSENTLLSYIADERIVEIAENMRFSDLAEYLPLEKHRAESFRFAGQTKLVSEIKAMFEEALIKQDRIGLVFITKSGRPEEPLLGILTAWDIAAVQ